MASEYRNRRFNSIYLVCSDITAKSMPWVFKKLQGSRIESLSIQTFKILGASDQEDVTDQYLPALIQNITPGEEADAVCKKIDFEVDQIEEAEGSVEKLMDFIDAHSPTGDRKFPIQEILVSLQNKQGNTVKNATDFVNKIFSNPEKWDMTRCIVSGFIMGQISKQLIPDWIKHQKNLEALKLSDCVLDAERLGMILDGLLETVLNNDRDYWFDFRQNKKSNIAVLMYKNDGGFDVQELLCDFLGKVPTGRSGTINLSCDEQVLKTWKRDDNDPTKVTLEYLASNEGEEERYETFVPAKFRETAPAE